MKKLLILLLLLCAVPAQAAISRTGSCSASTTSCTLSGTATGNLHLAIAFRSGSTTAPSLPAGWTTITTAATSTGGTTGSILVGCKVASSGSDTGSGTWTNATSVYAASYAGTTVKNSGDCNITGIGNFTTNNAKTSTTVTYGAITVQNTNNWVAGLMGDSASSTCTPTGMTSVSGTGTILGNDTNATVSSWSSTNCTVSSSTWLSAVVEIYGPPTCSGTCPTSASNWVGGPSSGLSTEFNHPDPERILYLPNTTISNNCLVVGATWGTGSASGDSLTTDQGDTLTRAFTTPPGNGNQVWQIFYGKPTAGSQKLTLAFTTGSPTFLVMTAAEFYNTDCTKDVTGSNSGSSAVADAGSMTPTASNDLIVQFADQDTSGSNTTWSPAAGFTALNRNFKSAVVAQYTVRTSTNAITPKVALDASHSWASAAIAFKSASSGSAPSAGIRVNSTRQDLFLSTDASPQTYTFDLTGNLGVISWIGNGTADTVTSITDTCTGATWAKAVSNSSRQISAPEIWYAVNATPCSGTYTITVHTPIGGSESIVFYDIGGAATSSVLDATNTAIGNQNGGFSSPLSAGSLTTTAANTIVIANAGVEFNGFRTVTPGSFDPQDNNNGFGHHFRATTGTDNFSWTTDQSGQAGGVGRWDFVAASFKAPAAAAAGVPQVFIIHP